MSLVEASNPRIPRKKGQPAKSKKHSDLYTDEDPKGTIHGLGFKDVATAKKSVSKIRGSSRSHAHKIQAAIAMEQRARVMGKTAEAAIYRSFINSMKKKTKKMNEEKVEEGWSDKYKKSIDCNNPKGFSQKAHCQGKKKKMNEDRQIKKIVKQLRKSVKSHAKQADTLEKKITEGSLHKWFKGSKSKDGKGGWVNVVTGGTCASDEPGEGTPKCVSSAKRASMSKKERLSAARRKKKADPNQQAKSGAAKPTYVATDKPKKKMKEELEYIDLPLEVEIPSNLRDFNRGLMFRESLENDKGMLFIFERVGQYSFYMKNTTIPLDVAFVTEDGIVESIKSLEPNDETAVSSDGQVLFAIEANRGWFTENNVEVGDEIVLGEAKDKKGKGSGTKDACYHKVKSRYSVWPSAYASGALVKCRKVGAANWGNKSESVEMKNYLDKKAKKLEKQRASQSQAARNNPAFDSTSPNSKDPAVARSRAEGYLPEEGYDIARDRGMVRPSKDKKDATTMPVSKDVKNMKGDTPMQKEFKKKYGAKATALDAVKQKYKGQMMNMKKEEVQRDEYGDPVGGPKISKKQKAKNLASNTPDEKNTTTSEAVLDEKKAQKCWPGYEKKGTKMMFGKRYNNCVKKEGFSNWRDELGYEGKDSSKKIDEDWQKVNRNDKTDGLSQKAVNAYRRENPGSKLKTAVTKDPKKLKKGSKSAKRRLSFCRRMKGMKKKLTSAKTSRDPDSRINKALRRWNCSYEPTGTTIAEKALSKKQQRFFGIVRAAQKGTLDGEASSQVQRAAADMKMKDVKKFASTKHKGLPEKVKSEE